MRPVLARLLRRQGPFVLACGVLLGLFEFLIAAAVASVDVSGAVQTVLDSLPPFLRSVIESQIFGGVSTGDLLAFGWNHPIAHALGTAVAVLIGAHAIAGEIDGGALELLLAQPVSRLRYALAQAVFAAAAIALTAGLGIAGTALGVRVFALGAIAPAALARTALNYAALLWAWFGVAFLLSALGREGGRAAGGGFLLALVSYVAFVIGSVWERASFVKPWTLHHWFAPRELLVAGHGAARPIALLVAVGTLAATAGVARFLRRDLP